MSTLSLMIREEVYKHTKCRTDLLHRKVGEREPAQSHKNISPLMFFCYPQLYIAM